MEELLSAGIDVYGDGSKKFILEDADAASCQVAIALTESDETNLIICEMCKEFFRVEKTVSMLNDPSKTDFFYQMGIERVVCALNMITNIRNPMGTGKVAFFLSLVA